MNVSEPSDKFLSEKIKISDAGESGAHKVDFVHPRGKIKDLARFSMVGPLRMVGRP